MHIVLDEVGDLCIGNIGFLFLIKEILNNFFFFIFKTYFVCFKIWNWKISLRLIFLMKLLLTFISLPDVLEMVQILFLSYIVDHFSTIYFYR